MAGTKDVARFGVLSMVLWFAILLLTNPAPAQVDTYWQHDPATPGDWFDPLNWSNGVPMFLSKAYIDNNGTADINAGKALAADLYVGYNAGQSGSVEFSGSGQWTGAVWMGGISSTTLYLGYNPGSTGTCELSDSANINSTEEYVGYGGTGTFTQTGGTNTISGALLLGESNGSGTYNLASGGQLSADTIELGPGPSHFNQSGGTVTAKSLIVTQNSAYSFSGGTLDLSRQFTCAGTFNFQSQSTTLSFPVSGIVNLNGVVNASQASLVCGPSSLIIYNPAAPPEAIFKTVTSTGFAMAAGSSVAIPSGRSVIGWGDITGHFNVDGLLDGSDRALNLTGGLTVSPAGQVNLRTGSLILDSDASSLAGTLYARYEYIGDTAPASISQSSGLNAVTWNINVGGVDSDPGGESTYNLSGTASLSAKNLNVGWHGNGTFNQNGGIITISESLSLGTYYGGSGAYNLTGPGLLVTGGISLGDGAPSLFNQTSGQVSTGRVGITSGSQYILAGGTLSISGSIVGPGLMDFQDQHGTLSAPDTGIIDLTSGIFRNTSQASLAGGPSSLIIYDPANPPSSLFKDVNTSGFMLPAGSSLTVPEGRSITGCGTIPGHIDLQGSISGGGWPPLAVNGGLFVFGSGSADFTGDTLTVEDSTSGITSGQITTKREIIGNVGTGLFTQIGGTNTARDSISPSGGGIILGSAAGSDGTYILSDSGICAPHTLTVGQYGSASFIQSGGTLTCQEAHIGSKGGAATYELRDGTFSSDLLYIIAGNDMCPGVGAFIQSGGLNQSASIHVSRGNYTQTGGTVSGTVYVGQSHKGSYELSGAAVLSSPNQYIGYNDVGTFTQSGGTNTVNALYLGYGAHGDGTYTISDGSLTASSLYVGYQGKGSFAITDPAAKVTVSSLLRFDVYGYYAHFAAVLGSSIHMTGTNFENKSTSESNLAGLANLTLIYDNQSPGAADTFEIASTDLGRNPAGFVNNFALGGIELDNNALVELVDSFNNGNRNGVGGAAEALYLDELTLLPGSTLDLNNLHLYVCDLDDQGGTILNGDLISMCPGDADGNWRVDSADLATWQRSYDPLGTTRTFDQGDWDGNGRIDSADLAIWQRNYSPLGMGVSPEVTPEPATLLLVGTGLLTLVGLRRRWDMN